MHASPQVSITVPDFATTLRASEPFISLEVCEQWCMPPPVVATTLEDMNEPDKGENSPETPGRTKQVSTLTSQGTDTHVSSMYLLVNHRSRYRYSMYLLVTRSNPSDTGKTKQAMWQKRRSKSPTGGHARHLQPRRNEDRITRSVGHSPTPNLMTGWATIPRELAGERPENR